MPTYMRQKQRTSFRRSTLSTDSSQKSYLAWLHHLLTSQAHCGKSLCQCEFYLASWWLVTLTPNQLTLQRPAAPTPAPTTMSLFLTRLLLEPMQTKVLGDDGSFRVTLGQSQAHGVKGERSIVTFRVYSNCERNKKSGRWDRAKSANPNSGSIMTRRLAVSGTRSYDP